MYLLVLLFYYLLLIILINLNLILQLVSYMNQMKLYLHNLNILYVGSTPTIPFRIFDSAVSSGAVSEAFRGAPHRWDTGEQR